MADLPDFSAKFLLDSSQFDDAVDKVLGRIGRVRAAVSGWSEDLTQLSNRAAALGVSLGIGLAPGVAGMISLESALARTLSVGDATELQIARITAAAKEMGSGVIGPTQVADSLYNLASAGLETEQQLTALPTVIQLAVASAVDLDTSSQLLVQTMRAFNLEASQTARIANVIAASNAVSSSNALRLAEAYKLVAANASAANLTLEETTAALNILIDVFQNGEQAGTGLRNVITRLAAGGPQLREAADKAGISIRNLNPSVVGLGVAIENLAQLMAVDASAAFAIFGDRGQTTANILAANAERFADMEEAITGTNALLGQFNRQTATTSARLRTMRNQVVVTGIAYSQGLKPFIDASAGALTGLMVVLNAVPAPLKAVIGAVAAAVAGFLLWQAILFRMIKALLTTTFAQNILNATQKAFWGLLAESGVNVEHLQGLLRGLTVANLQAAASGDKLALVQVRQGAVAVVLAAKAAILATALGALRNATMAAKAALAILIANPVLVAIGLALVILQQLARYAEILRPALVQLRGSFSAMASTALGLREVSDVLKVMGAFLNSVLIAAMEVLALVTADVAYRFRLLALNLQFMRDAGAARNLAQIAEAQARLREETAAATEEWMQLRREIDATAQAATNAAWGIAAADLEELRRQLGMTEAEFAALRATALATYASFTQLASDIVFDIDATPFERTIRSIRETTAQLIKDLAAELDENPLLGLLDVDGNEVQNLADSMYGTLLAAIERAGRDADAIATARFIADIQRQVDDARINALRDGAEKLEAQHALREADIARQQAESLRGLEEGSLDYIAVLEHYTDLILLNRARYAEELAELEERIAQTVENAQREVTDRRIAAMEDGEAKIRAQAALRVEDARKQSTERLEFVQDDTDAYEAIKNAEAELVGLLNAEMLREIELHNKRVADALRQSTETYRGVLDELQRESRRLTTGAQGDPFTALLLGQQVELERAAEGIRSALAAVAADAETGIITLAEATERGAAIMAAWAANEAATRGGHLRDQRAFNASREADQLAHRDRIAAIYDSMAAAAIEDPVQQAAAERDAELARLDAWLAERALRTERDYAQRLADEEEFQARRAQTIANAERAIAAAQERASEELQRAIAERVSAEATTSASLRQSGIAGIVNVEDLRLSAQRLREVASELRALGATGETLAGLREELEDTQRAIATLAREARTFLGDTLASVAAEVRELTEDLYFTDAERGQSALRRTLQGFDEQLVSARSYLRERLGDTSAFHDAMASLEEATAERRRLTVERFNRDVAKAESDRVDAVQDANAQIGRETDRLQAGLIRDRVRSEQALYRVEQADRRRQFFDQLDDLRATNEERIELIGGFRRREMAIEEEHARSVTALIRQSTEARFSGFAQAQAQALQLQDGAAQAAARAYITNVDAQIEALRRQEEAQRASLTTTAREIDLLRERNTALLASISAVSQVRSYYEQVRDLFQDPRDAGDPRVEAERDRAIAKQLFDDAVRANVPLNERAALLRDLIALNERVVESGGESIGPDFAIVAAARAEYERTIATAQRAADEWNRNESAITEMEGSAGTLESALATLAVEIKALGDELTRLNRITQGEIWDAAEGRFLDVADAAVLARQRYLDAITQIVMESGNFIGAVSPQIAEELLSQLERGDFQALLRTYSLQTGHTMTQGMLEGLLNTPVPGNTGETLAETLGITDVPALMEKLATQGMIKLAEEIGESGEAEAEGEESAEQIFAAMKPVIDEAVLQLGEVAGRGLMEAFAEGIRANEGVILSAVEAVLVKVRDLLPSSDAKRGPLSDLTFSGGRLVTTFAKGAENRSGELAKRMEGVFAHARPGAMGPSPTRMHFGVGGGDTHSTSITINDKREGVTGPVHMATNTLMSAVRREVDVTRRLRQGGGR
ncbi:MAG: phage tail tape measure protein [Trueperaceae bacterium]|nr:phage tail tape measure protein [Trueperaceae bacterium]